VKRRKKTLPSSVQCGFFHGIKPLELVAGITRGELPDNTSALLVAFGFHRRHLTAQGDFVF
jgi:hypothetical protein